MKTERSSTEHEEMPMELGHVCKIEVREFSQLPPDEVEDPKLDPGR
jgi:hypothetical protein